MSRLVHLAGSLGALLLLAGCGVSGQITKSACPRLSLAQDADSFTRFDGKGTDITDVVLSGHFDALPAKCGRASETIVQTELNLVATLTRGPAAKSNSASATAIVTVLRGDTIVDQQDVALYATFPPNVSDARVSTDQLTLNFPVPPNGSAAGYRVIVAFRLTPAELAFNRSNPNRL